LACHITNYTPTYCVRPALLHVIIMSLGSSMLGVARKLVCSFLTNLCGLLNVFCLMNGTLKMKINMQKVKPLMFGK